jgi:mRNA-degrading endonuclease toxin of MazEF toxin-antitoxin module
MPTPMRTPSMTSYDFGIVVLVNFPQSGTTIRKQRPGIVVLDIGDADLVIAPVTSKSRSQAGDCRLDDLAGTGLIRPSCVRLAKVATLLKADLVRALGRLSPGDRNQLAQSWQTLYESFVS